MTLSLEHATACLIARGLLPTVNAYTEDLFLRCAKAGDGDAVRAYLALGMPVDTRDNHDQGTALIRAAEGNHPDVLGYLAEARADLEARDKDDDTALLTAVNWGHLGALRALIALGADLNAVSRKHGVPLASAVSDHKPDLIAALLEAGADVDASWGEHGDCPLYTALVEDNATYVAQLIAAGANVNARIAHHKRTLLLSAIHRKRESIALQLIAASADPEASDALGWTPWRTAMYLDQPEVAAALTAAGAQTPYAPEVRFFQAAQTGNVAALRDALHAGVDINACDPDGYTALMLACYTGHDQAVRFLLAQGAATTSPLPDKSSPLMLAVHALSLPCVEALLEHGVPPHDGPDWALLGKPARENARDILVRLVAAGADINGGEYTALHWVAIKQHLRLLDWLIEAGANLDAQTGDGDTPLKKATGLRQGQAALRLIAAGANPKLAGSRGQTPLHDAAAQGHAAVVSALLAAGAAPGARDDLGLMPLDQASSMGHTECDQLLRRALLYQPVEETLAAFGFDVEPEMDALPAAFFPRLAQTLPATALLVAVEEDETQLVAGLLRAGLAPDERNGYAETALMVAAAKGHTSIVQALLRAGADVGAQSNTGSTALHKAAYNGELGALRALLAAGSDPNHYDNWRHTPVHAAAEGGHIAALAALHLVGGALDPDPVGESPLMRAVRFDKHEALLWLIESGAQVNTRNHMLDTPLSLAVAKRNVAGAARLLDAGAAADAVGKDGYTPLMLAAEAGEQELVRLLLQARADPLLRNAQGQSTLDLAANRPEVAAILSAATGTTPQVPSLRPAEVPPKPPLHRAAQRGDLAGVQQLLAEGIPVDTRSTRGDTALMLAAERGHTEIVQALLAARADVHARNGVGTDAVALTLVFGHDETRAVLEAAGAARGLAALDRMAEHLGRLDALSAALSAGSIAKVTALVESGEVDIDGLGAGQQSALIRAVQQGDAPLARLVLALGADIELPTPGGFTPLMMAARSNQPTLATLLLTAGAAVDAVASSGVTALLLAAGEGFLEMVDCLLTDGADPNRGDNTNVTPLMQAIASGNEAVAQRLIAAGADSHARTTSGMSVNDWKLLYNQPESLAQPRPLKEKSRNK